MNILRECPYCGAEPKLYIIPYNKISYVYCPKCRAESPTATKHETPAACMQDWNNRIGIKEGVTKK